MSTEINAQQIEHLIEMHVSFVWPSKCRARSVGRDFIRCDLKEAN